jgi:ketosteroid isomerase-like protein
MRFLADMDINEMAENWDQSSSISMDNPLGGIKRGWEDIRSVYENIFSGPGRVKVEFYDYSIHEFQDIFLAIGRERGEFEKEGQRMELAIRTSRIFKRHAGGWKQIHHHGSIDDPKLLERYQTAVIGK